MFNALVCLDPARVGQETQHSGSLLSRLLPYNAQLRRQCHFARKPTLTRAACHEWGCYSRELVFRTFNLAGTQPLLNHNAHYPQPRI